MFPKGEIKVVHHWLFLCSKGGLFNFKNSRVPFSFHDYPFVSALDKEKAISSTTFKCSFISQCP